MWRVPSLWRRCGASACSLAGPSSSSAGARLRWTSTVRRYARARGCGWQTRSEAVLLAWPHPVAPLVWLLRPGRLRRILLRRAWLCASPARTAACATRWPHGAHTHGGDKACGFRCAGAVPDARVAVGLERLAATVLRRGAFRASCAAAPHRPPARDKPVLPVMSTRLDACVRVHLIPFERGDRIVLNTGRSIKKS